MKQIQFIYSNSKCEHKFYYNNRLLNLIAHKLPLALTISLFVWDSRLTKHCTKVSGKKGHFLTNPIHDCLLVMLFFFSLSKIRDRYILCVTNEQIKSRRNFNLIIPRIFVFPTCCGCKNIHNLQNFLSHCASFSRRYMNTQYFIRIVLELNDHDIHIYLTFH